MMRRYAVPALLLVLGCRERAATLNSAPAASVASASPGTGDLVLPSDITVSGLRVMTGSWHGAWGVSDVAPDLQQTRLKIVKTHSPHGSLLEQLALPSTLALINGGYFESDYRPSTWLVDGAELAPKSDTSKGGVLALGTGDSASQLGSPSRPFVGAFSDLHFEPTLAVQSFPLIVEAGGRVGIHKDDGRRAARTIACLSERQLHFIVIAAPRGDGPTLLETAQLLRAPRPAGFGCDVALNLDGGPSSGVWFAPSIPTKSRPPMAPVAYAIAVRRPTEH
jgi:hypothetical protein